MVRSPHIYYGEVTVQPEHSPYDLFFPVKPGQPVLYHYSKRITVSLTGGGPLSLSGLKDLSSVSLFSHP